MKTSQTSQIRRWIYALFYGIIFTGFTGGCEYILPNKPPFVEKLTPADSVLFPVGSIVPFTVNAYDIDGTIDRVIFKAPGSEAFADSVIPYAFNWVTTGMTEGTYQVEIKALDNDGEVYGIQVPIRLITGAAANAGRDTTITSSATQYTLQAYNPGTSTGTWSILSGEGGQLSDIHSHNAMLTGLPCHSYTLRWTVTNPIGTVADEVVITFMHQPSPASAGDDQVITNGQLIADLSATVPTEGTGQWTILAGGAGTFSDTALPDARFTGQACSSYTLVWTVSTACAASSDTVNIRFEQTLIVANAGSDQIFQDGRTTTTLAANTPAVGTGTWTVMAGLNGQFSDTHDPHATFTGSVCLSYILRWTVVTSCNSAMDEVVITFEHTPSEADAGPDQSFEDGRSVAILAANVPATGTGTWTVTSGVNGQFDDVADPHTTFRGNLCHAYVLTWTITASCGTRSDNVSIAFSNDPSIANAGPDIRLYGSVRTTALAANTPAFGTGSWSIISGVGGILGNPSDPETLFTGEPCQTYALSWTITAGCGTSSDNMTVTIIDLPSEPDAGPDQHLIDGSVTATLSGNTPSHGTGMWILVSGGAGTFSDVHKANSTFTGQLCHTYTLRWTISTECDTYYDEMILILDQVIIQADAGPDQKLINGAVSTILQANTPGSGMTGTWSIAYGSGGSFSNIHDPAANFTGEIGHVYRLKWSFSSNCAENSDEVLIAILGTQSFSDARDSKDYHAVVIGNHIWMAENMNYNSAGSYVYDDNPIHAPLYGRLYDWNSAQAACPSGWHLPSDDEWRDLERTLGMEDATTLLEWYRGTSEGGMLKEEGTVHWATPNTGASNLSGFSALPGGYRTNSGSYEGITYNTGFWTSTADGDNKAIYRALNTDKAQIGRDWSAKDLSFSVRCVKN
ncbi:MAG: FISUMP domain-containing protein [Bacteroidota bacterium]